jgi:hypothetical protein
MFGYSIVNKEKQKKKKDKFRKEKEIFENDKNLFNAQKPGLERENDLEMKNQINQQAQQSKENRHKAREEGWNYGQDVFNRNVQGLTPEQRKAIQYEASQRINRDTQAAERKLLGEQGRRGIGGKSGVAFAQQQELARAGQEAQGQVARDTEKLNADLALKKIAAMFSSAQGEAAQSQLDRQMAADELELSQEKKRQRALEDKFNHLFSRV